MAGMDFPLGTSVSGEDWRRTGKRCVSEQLEELALETWLQIFAALILNLG